MKKIFIYLTFVIAFTGSRFAYADFEAVETALTKLEDIQKEAQNVQDELKRVQSEINNIHQGNLGNLGILSSEIPNLGKINVKTTQETSSALENGENLQKAVKNDTTAVYTNKDQDATYFSAKDKKEAISRENLARLYAYALTLRTNMAKNRKEHKADDTPITAKDGREILKATAAEGIENARHFSHIWDMQSSIFELYLMEQVRIFSDKVPVNSDEGE